MPWEGGRELTCAPQFLALSRLSFEQAVVMSPCSLSIGAGALSELNHQLVSGLSLLFHCNRHSHTPCCLLPAALCADISGSCTFFTFFFFPSLPNMVLVLSLL